MKKQILILSCIILSFIGCEKIDEVTQFDMEFNETVVIPSTIGVNLPFNILTPNIETNSESTFAVNDTRKDLIEEITLKTLNLTLTSPSNADFSFLTSIIVYISAEDLPEIKVAWKDRIPDDIGNVLDLELSDVDLKEYIQKDEFDIRLNTTTNKLLLSDHSINLHSVFFVDAKILGI